MEIKVQYKLMKDKNKDEKEKEFKQFVKAQFNSLAKKNLDVPIVLYQL